MKKMNRDRRSKRALLIITLFLTSCSHQQHPTPSQGVSPSFFHSQDPVVLTKPWTPPDPSLVANVANPSDRTEFLKALAYFPPDVRNNIMFLNIDSHALYSTSRNMPILDANFYDSLGDLPNSTNNLLTTDFNSADKAFLMSTMSITDDKTTKTPQQAQQEFVNCTDNNSTGAYFRFTKTPKVDEKINWMRVLIYLPKYDTYFNIPDFNAANLYSSKSLLNTKNLKYVINTPNIYIGGFSVNTKESAESSDSLDVGFTANTGKYDGGVYKLKGGWSLFVRDQKSVPSVMQPKFPGFSVSSNAINAGSRFAEDSYADLYFFHKDNLLFAFVTGKRMNSNSILDSLKPLNLGIVMKANESNWDKLGESNIYKVMVSMAQSYSTQTSGHLASVLRTTAKLNSVVIAGVDFGYFDNPDKQYSINVNAANGAFKGFENRQYFPYVKPAENTMNECIFPKLNGISQDIIKGKNKKDAGIEDDIQKVDFNLIETVMDNFVVSSDSFALKSRGMDFSKEHKAKLSIKEDGEEIGDSITFKGKIGETITKEIVLSNIGERYSTMMVIPYPIGHETGVKVSGERIRIPEPPNNKSDKSPWTIKIDSKSEDGRTVWLAPQNSHINFTNKGIEDASVDTPNILEKQHNIAIQVTCIQNKNLSNDWLIIYSSGEVDNFDPATGRDFPQDDSWKEAKRTTISAISLPKGAEPIHQFPGLKYKEITLKLNCGAKSPPPKNSVIITPKKTTTINQCTTTTTTKYQADIQISGELSPTKEWEPITLTSSVLDGTAPLLSFSGGPSANTASLKPLALTSSDWTGKQTIDGQSVEKIYTLNTTYTTNLGPETASTSIKIPATTTETSSTPNCHTPPPPPPPPCPGCKGPAGPSGDPHIQTFDSGADYDFQGVGEFILARTPDRSYEVQVRMKPAGTEASVNSAAAMTVNGDRVGVYALGATAGNGGVGLLNINGQDVPFSLAQSASMSLPHGGDIVINAVGSNTAILYVYWPDGSKAVLGIHPEIVGFVNLYVSPALQGRLEGLLGNADGNAVNDRRGRDGTVYPLDLAYPDIYTKFGNSWRVSQPESLFQYASGQDTNTFTDLNFPPAPTPIPAAVQSQAQATCQAAGIIDTKTLNNCIYDVSVTQGQPIAQTLVQAAAVSDPSTPRVNIAAASSALAVSQTTTLHAEVNADASVGNVQWTTSAGTLTKNNDGTVTLVAPTTPTDMLVTATLAGASSTIHIPVLASSVIAGMPLTVFAGQTGNVSVNLVGDSTGKTINWTATQGSITPTGQLSATYTAPAMAGTATITAQLAGSSDKATIPVTVVAPSLVISPSDQVVNAGDVLGFAYTGAGFDASQATVNWSATGGTLVTGLGSARYTAPMQAGEYTVTASVAGFPNVQGSAHITVKNLNLTVDPPSATLPAGESQVFQANISGISNPSALNWVATGGTIVPSGNSATFTAPRQAGTYTVTATAGELQTPVTVTVPPLQPSIQTPWPADQAIAFPSMKLNLNGVGLLPQRANWTASAGTIAPTGASTDNNNVTLTTPATAGDVTVTYAHSLYPDVQASTKFTVQAPNITLSTPKEQYSVGELVLAQVQGVPSYLCPSLKSNVGQLSDCVVKWQPTAGGSQTITVSLGDVPNTTASKTIQVGGLNLVIANGGKVHAGTPLTFQVQDSFGQPYGGNVNWEVSGNGGSVAPYTAGNGTATFQAGNAAGTYTITAHADGGAVLGTGTVQVYLDPITLASSSNVTRVGEQFTVQATHGANLPYPVALDWQATGATLLSATSNKATFKTTAVSGPVTISAAVPGTPNITAQAQLTAIDLAPTLTLTNGTAFEGKQLLRGQHIDVQARTSTGAPFTQELDWTRSFTSATTTGSAGSAGFDIPTYLNYGVPAYQAQLMGCLKDSPSICSTLNFTVNQLNYNQVTPLTAGGIDGVLVGEHLKYALSGSTDLPQPLTVSYNSQLQQFSALPVTAEITDNQASSNAISIYFGNNDTDSISIDTPKFAQPQASIYQQSLMKTASLKQNSNKFKKLSVIAPTYQPVLPGQQLNVVALLPSHSTIPPLTWYTTTGSFTSTGNTTAVYTASKVAATKDDINVAVQGTPVDNSWYLPLHFQVVPAGLYLTSVAQDPTGKTFQLPMLDSSASINGAAGKFTFGTAIVGYPNDQIVWDSIVGNKTDLGNGIFTISSVDGVQSIHLAAHLRDHPDIKLVFDGNFYTAN